MMKEDTRVRQIPGERRRRWFSSEQFDLIVWYEVDGTLAGFELCYDKARHPRALIWHPQNGVSHMAVDDGESRAGKHKATPVYVADGDFDAARVCSEFRKHSQALPADVAACVLRVLETHPREGSAS